MQTSPHESVAPLAVSMQKDVGDSVNDGVGVGGSMLHKQPEQSHVYVLSMTEHV